MMQKEVFIRSPIKNRQRTILIIIKGPDLPGPF
jgi:hypothetical protein